MKTWITALLVSLLALPSFAINVALVDIQYIVDKSSAAKDIARQVESRRDTVESEIKKQESRLKEDDEELTKLRATLSSDAYQAKAKIFKDKVLGAQKKIQERRAALEDAYVDSLRKVRETTKSIIGDLASGKGFDIAIPKSTVLYSGGNVLDISDDVLAELNSKLPSITLK